MTPLLHEAEGDTGVRNQSSPLRPGTCPGAPDRQAGLLPSLSSPPQSGAKMLAQKKIAAFLTAGEVSLLTISSALTSLILFHRPLALKRASVSTVLSFLNNQLFKITFFFEINTAYPAPNRPNFTGSLCACNITQSHIRNSGGLSFSLVALTAELASVAELFYCVHASRSVTSG